MIFSMGGEYQRSNRGFVHLLAILIIAFILGVAFMVFYINSKKTSVEPKIKSYNESTISATPTEEDKVFIDTDLDFEFSYSTQFKAEVDSEEGYSKRNNGNFRKNFSGYIGYEPGSVITAVAVLDKSLSFDINPFSVWVFDNSNNLSVENWYEKYWYYPFVWGDFSGRQGIAPNEVATISGQEAKSGMVLYQPGTPKFVYISKGKNIFLFRIINDSEKTGDKIMASFKFLSDDLKADEKKAIDLWIKKNKLNIYGDSSDTLYAGGTPLFNEKSGETTNRYDYILRNNPNRPWNL